MIPHTMRAYQLQREGVRLAEVGTPAIGPYDALVRITHSSVCGTDLQIIHYDDWSKEHVPLGTVIGHEGAGRIAAVGDQVKEFKVGDFVALESHYSCEECLAARRTLDACQHQGIMGVYGILQNDKRTVPRGGTFAEYVSIPHTSLHHVPEELMGNFQPSLLEPAGNSWKIAQYFRVKGIPSTALVFGCGPHGIFAQLFLKHIGVQRLIAADPHPERRAFAASFCADLTFAPNIITPEFLMENEFPLLLDAALDIAGAPGVMEQAITLVRPAGTVVMFGLPKSPKQNIDGIPYDKIIFGSRNFRVQRQGKEVTIVGFNGRSDEGWKTLIQELSDNAALRAKLMWPLEKIGALDKLATVIAEIENNTFKNTHKIGMTGFQ